MLPLKQQVTLSRSCSDKGFILLCDYQGSVVNTLNLMQNFSNPSYYQTCYECYYDVNGTENWKLIEWDSNTFVNCMSPLHALV